MFYATFLALCLFLFAFVREVEEERREGRNDDPWNPILRIVSHGAVNVLNAPGDYEAEEDSQQYDDDPLADTNEAYVEGTQMGGKLLCVYLFLGLSGRDGQGFCRSGRAFGG